MVKNYQEAVEYLYSIGSNNRILKPWGQFGFERNKYLHDSAGNPQNSLKIIHVAGTSGKGSTSYLIAKLLNSQGFKVGLDVSPHLLDIRERMQIFEKWSENDILKQNLDTASFISEEIFVECLNKIIPAIEKTTHSFFGEPSFYEITTALAFAVFTHQKVDYAVVEVGAGGLIDSTNVIDNENKLCVFTPQGLDHQDLLGDTIAQIVFNDSGIIQKNNTSVSVYHSELGNQILSHFAAKNQSHIYFLNPSNNITNLKNSDCSTTFDFSIPDFKLQNVELGMIGSFQAQNCALSLLALAVLSKRDSFTVDELKLRDMLKKSRFKGRFEVFKIGNKTVVIDGAHNPQKMETFIDSLQNIYPERNFEFLLAIKSNKDYKEMLNPILKCAKCIYTTDFDLGVGFKIFSVPAQQLREDIINCNYHNVKSLGDLKSDLINIVDSNVENILVVTGSLYLISLIYEDLQNLSST